MIKSNQWPYASWPYVKPWMPISSGNSFATTTVPKARPTAPLMAVESLIVQARSVSETSSQQGVQSGAATKKASGEDGTTVARKRWTKEEDEVLTTLMGRFGGQQSVTGTKGPNATRQDWAVIAASLPGRTRKQIRERSQSPSVNDSCLGSLDQSSRVVR